MTKRIGPQECRIGDKCMVLSDYSGVSAGTKGKVVEIDGHESVTIQWLECEDCAIGHSCGPRPREDVFIGDELYSLVFATYAHPAISPRVVNINNPKK